MKAIIAIINNSLMTQEDHDWTHYHIRESQAGVEKYTRLLAAATGSRIGCYTAHLRRCEKDLARYTRQLTAEHEAIEIYADTARGVTIDLVDGELVVTPR